MTRSSSTTSMRAASLPSIFSRRRNLCTATHRWTRIGRHSWCRKRNSLLMRHMTAITNCAARRAREHEHQDRFRKARAIDLQHINEVIDKDGLTEDQRQILLPGGGADSTRGLYRYFSRLDPGDGRRLP